MPLPDDCYYHRTEQYEKTLCTVHTLQITHEESLIGNLLIRKPLPLLPIIPHPVPQPGLVRRPTGDLVRDEEHVVQDRMHLAPPVNRRPGLFDLLERGIRFQRDDLVAQRESAVIRPGRMRVDNQTGVCEAFFLLGVFDHSDGFEHAPCIS